MMPAERHANYYSDPRPFERVAMIRMVLLVLLALHDADPQENQHSLNLAIARYMEGRYPRVVEECNRLLTTAPRLPHAQYLRGRAQLALQQTSRASPCPCGIRHRDGLREGQCGERIADTASAPCFCVNHPRTNGRAIHLGKGRSASVCLSHSWYCDETRNSA